VARFLCGESVRANSSWAVGRLRLVSRDATSNEIDQYTLELKETFNSTVCAIMQRKNQATSLHNLPDELCIGIMSHLPTADLVSASHVCVHWRQTIFSTPLLWSNLDFNCLNRPWPVSAIQTLVQRSKPLPIKFTYRNDQPKGLEEGLITHPALFATIIERATWLDMAISDFMSMRSILQHPAPQLLSAQLVLTRGGLTIFQLFGGIAPNLVCLTLDAVYISRHKDDMCFPSVRYLGLSKENSTMSLLDDMPELADFFPNLNQLCFGKNPSPPTYRTLCDADSQLAKLSVHLLTMDVDVSVLEVDLGVIPLIHLHSMPWECHGVDKLLRRYFLSVPTLHVLDYVVEGKSDDGRVFSWTPCPDPSFLYHMFNKVETVVVTPDRLLRLARPMPKLTTLTIEIGIVSQHTLREMFGDRADVRDAVQWAVPTLQHLKLVWMAPPQGHQPQLRTICIRELAHLVFVYFAVQPRDLLVLQLDNIVLARIVDDTDVQLLESLARNITVTSNVNEVDPFNQPSLPHAVPLVEQLDPCDELNARVDRLFRLFRAGPTALEEAVLDDSDGSDYDSDVPEELWSLDCAWYPPSDSDSDPYSDSDSDSALDIDDDTPQDADVENDTPDFDDNQANHGDICEMITATQSVNEHEDRTLHVEREPELLSATFQEEVDDVGPSELNELHNDAPSFFDIPLEVLESQRRLIPTYQAKPFARVVKHSQDEEFQTDP